MHYLEFGPVVLHHSPVVLVHQGHHAMRGVVHVHQGGQGRHAGRVHLIAVTHREVTKTRPVPTVDSLAKKYYIIIF